MSAANGNGNDSKAQANGNGNGNGKSAAPITVFVAGGTSNTGSATINALLRYHPHVTVKAGVRDVAKAKTKFADALKQYNTTGVNGTERLQFVAHDVKANHLTAAASAAADAAELKGVDTLLLVPPQGYGDRLGVATAYATAAKSAGVRLIAVVSTPAVSNPKLVLSRDLAATEQIIAASGVPYTALRAVFFYDNHWGNVKTISPTDGSAAFYAPIKADVPIQSIAVSDIGEAAANVLAGARNGDIAGVSVESGVNGAVKAHGGKSYWIGGPALTHSAMAGVFSRVLNKAVAFHSATDDGAVAALGALGWPEAMARGFCELYHYYEAGNYAENTSALQRLLNGGRAPTTLAQWLVALGTTNGAAGLGAFGGVKQHVFVAGAAGNTGSATVKALLRDHPFVSVTAGVRDAKKAEGVFSAELADVTLNARERLRFAVHDVKASTSAAAGSSSGADSALHLTAAGTAAADAAELKGVDTLVFVPPQGTADRAGIAAAYLSAAKSSGTVKHVVTITAPGVVKPQLILTAGLAAVESAISSAFPGAYTFVRPVFFFENHFGSADTIKGHGAFYAPAAADAKIPGIAVADIGEATANAATWGGAAGADRKGLWGKAFAVAGEVQSNTAAADVFTRVTGKRVAYVAVSDDQCVQALTAKGWPATAARGIAELSRGFESGAFGAIDTAALQSLLNDKRLPTRLEQWLKPIAAAFTQA